MKIIYPGDTRVKVIPVSVHRYEILPFNEIHYNCMTRMNTRYSEQRIPQYIRHSLLLYTTEYSSELILQYIILFHINISVYDIIVK